MKEIQLTFTPLTLSLTQSGESQRFWLFYETPEEPSISMGVTAYLYLNASRSVTALQNSARTMWYTGVAIASVYGIISVLGLIGNITLIKTFCSAKSIRNVPNLFMSSLALGDLLLLVTCAPVDASRYLTEEWLFGRVGCKVIPFIQLTSVGVSVFTLTALSADR